MKLDLLAVAAHPDDVELTCSGTLIHHVNLGKKVGVADLTQGQLGTRGTPELRLKEAQKAAQVMGLETRDNLGFEDGFFANDTVHQKEVIRTIRRYKPEIVITNAIYDRHPDHGRASELVRDACFMAGLRKIETEDQGSLQEAWRPRAVYYSIQDRYIRPDFIVDISSDWKKKLEAIAAFESQFYNTGSNEPETYISQPGFMEFIESRAREMGHAIGVTYGEGFVCQRPMGVNNMFDLF